MLAHPTRLASEPHKAFLTFAAPTAALVRQPRPSSRRPILAVARKLNLRNDLKFSPAQKGHCGGPGGWTLPPPSANTPRAASLTKKCSLNDENWFVLLQLR